MTNNNLHLKGFLFFIAIMFAYTTLLAQDQTDAPTISPKGGLYTDATTISMTGPSGSNIYYTTDGSVPTTDDAIYSEPINIMNTTPLRAVAIVPDEEPSIPQTETYLYDVNHSFAIVSVVADPIVLFDPQTGLYPNFWQDIEAPANVEMFEPNGEQAFSQLVEIEISGSSSATNAQKSLAIKAKKSLGGSKIKYPIFPGGEFDEYRSLVLRNSGQDWNFKMFHDAFVSGLIREDEDVQDRILPARVNHQDYRPGVVYINGEYWGIHNIRERMDKRYIRVHFDLDDDEIDLIDEDVDVKEGDLAFWTEMQTYLQTVDLSGDATLDTISNFVDIDKYMDNVVFNVYIDNADWPGKNNRRFREREGGTFEWLLKDHDFTYGFYTSETGAFNSGFAGSNSLARLINGTFFNWPSPEWSNRLFNKLLENDDWRHNFINRMADQINVFYNKDRMLDRIDEYEQLYQPEIQQHFDRWKETFNVHAQDVDKLRTFANDRTAYVYDHFIQAFSEIDSTADISINASPAIGGSIEFSTINTGSVYEGTWFTGVPIPISATPAPGFVFTGWTGLLTSATANTSITLTENGVLTANFAPIDPNCMDEDSDGVCAAFDCDDTDASIPAIPNTICDDGDLFTTNDVIQADGCTCLGDQLIVSFQVACEADRTIAIPEGSSMVAIAFDQPTVSSNCPTGNTTIEQLNGPELNASVGEGTYQIVFTASDDCGNTIECEQTITVVTGEVGGCTLVATAGAGSIIITGITSADNIKLFDNNFAILWECNPWFGTPCPTSETITGLIPNTTYSLSVQSDVCNEWLPITVIEGEVAPSCSDGIQNQNETGIDCGGPCDPCSDTPTCSDGIHNQNETGIDCGGPCTPCSITPNCTDGIQNQNETGIDCGGPCAPCNETPNCSDGIQNQNESGIDCGGPCAPCNETPNCTDGIQNQDEILTSYSLLGEYGNSFYFMSNNIMTFATAQNEAASMGGHITSITSAGENEFIRSNLNGKIVLIGLNDLANEGTLGWDNGEPLTYNNLNATNGDGVDVGAINFWNGEWDLNNHQTHRPYILEIPCDNISPRVTAVESTNAIKINSIFPNPTTGDLFLQFQAEQDIHTILSISNSTGQKVMDYPIDLESGHNTISLDLQNLSTGIYHLVVKDGNGELEFRRFVKYER